VEELDGVEVITFSHAAAAGRAARVKKIAAALAAGKEVR
jgi:hypothetical protein